MAPALSWWFRAFIVFMALKRAANPNLQPNLIFLLLYCSLVPSSSFAAPRREFLCPEDDKAGNCQIVRILPPSFCLIRCLAAPAWVLA